MDLIHFVGVFCTTPLFFGLSVLNILVITFVFNMVIGILLGGIEFRAKSPSSDVPMAKNINQVSKSELDRIIKS